MAGLQDPRARDELAIAPREQAYYQGIEAIDLQQRIAYNGCRCQHKEDRTDAREHDTYPLNCVP